MSRKKTQKVMVYFMLAIMLLSTLLAGASMWF